LNDTVSFIYPWSLAASRKLYGTVPFLYFGSESG